MKFSTTIIAILVLTVTACGEDDEIVVPGSNLDTTFGTNGQVTTQMDTNGTQSHIQRILIDSSDNIYAIGFLGDSRDSLAVAKYSADGALDTSFATNGKLVADFGDRFEASDAVFHSDGRLIIVGTSQNSSLQSYDDIAIAVVNTDGSLDTNIDTDGRLTFNIETLMTSGNASFDRGFGISRSTVDGAFYISGESSATESEPNSIVIKLDSNLNVVSGYGVNGVAFSDFISNNEETSFDMVETSGQAIVAGNVETDSGDLDFMVGKLTSAGTIDADFNTDGVLTVDQSGNDEWIEKILLTDSEANAIAIGWTSSGTGDAVDTDLLLVKFDIATGTLDTNFGNSGITTLELNNTNSRVGIRNNNLDGVIDENGKIVITSQNGLDEFQHMTTFRFNVDGNIDTTYGANGILGVPRGANIEVGSGKAIAIQSTGKIIAGGQIGANNDRHFNLVRLNN